MKKEIREYLEWLHKKENISEAVRNPKKFVLEDGRILETSTTMWQTMILWDKEHSSGSRIDLWSGIGTYVIGGKEFSPVDAAMWMIFGAENGNSEHFAPFVSEDKDIVGESPEYLANLSGMSKEDRERFMIGKWVCKEDEHENFDWQTGNR